MKQLLPIHNDTRSVDVTSHPDYMAWLTIGAHQMCLDTFSQSMLVRHRVPDAHWNAHQTLLHVHANLLTQKTIEPGILARSCAQSGDDFLSVLAQQVGEADGEILAYVILRT
ncbi:MAG: hypothetical protein RI947_1071, partial [Candidatus Parcubacteria bacterium]